MNGTLSKYASIINASTGASKRKRLENAAMIRSTTYGFAKNTKVAVKKPGLKIVPVEKAKEEALFLTDSAKTDTADFSQNIAENTVVIPEEEVSLEISGLKTKEEMVISAVDKAAKKAAKKLKNS